MIEVENLSRNFRNFRALEGVSFAVQPGEILGLIGHNGSGKTTTIRCLTGILSPSAGKIRIGGVDLESDPVGAKKYLAYLPDNPAFFENLTAWEHVEFVARIYGKENFEKTANELFDRFDLSASKKSLGSELSRGMRQRLSIICALIHGPKVLLMDEPMLGLDPAGIRLLNQVLVEQAKAGAAILISSHLLALLEEICTNVLVLNGGKVQIYGSVEQVRKEISQKMDRFSLEELFFYATEHKPK